MLLAALCTLLLALGSGSAFAGSSVLEDSQPMTLQDAVNGYQSTTNGHAGVPEDWSNHRLVFSRPAPASPAYDKVTREPRYWMQELARMRKEMAIYEPGMLVPAKARANVKTDWKVSLGAGIVNPNTYPAKFSFSTTSASCNSDYVVYPTGTAGSSSQGTIIAYNKLYTGNGCNSGTPSIYWQYNTAYPQGSTSGDGSTVTTSPVIYTDGIQVAFVQVNSSGVASLVMLKSTSNSSLVQMDTATTNVARSNYRSCSAPCMTKIAFDGAPSDTWSAPFYDYTKDELYVGDDTARLHKFTGVFLGTPTEVTFLWPISLSGTLVASPVYDSSSGYVFVGTTAGTLYAIGSGNSGTVSGSIHGTSSNLTSGSSGGVGIYDAPLVDSSTGQLYVFVGSASSSGSDSCQTDDNCVHQFPTSFTSGFGSQQQDVNAGGGGDYFFDGDFDNVYYSTSGGTAGNIYVVGRTGGFGGILYRIPFASGSIGTPVVVGGGRINSTSVLPHPSPVTEFCNNGTSACTVSGGKTTAGNDYIFVSVYRGTTIPCQDKKGHGCILAFNVSDSSSITSVAGDLTTYGDPGCWVTGGIIIDNSVPSGTQSGASQIYFYNLESTATNLCGKTGSGAMSGVQASQSAP